VPPQSQTAIGLVGPFDTMALDAQVGLRVVGAELRRRAPQHPLRAFAPFGSARPIAIAADEAVEALTPVTAERRRGLSGELALFVAIGELAGPDAYPGYPEIDPPELTAAVALLRDPPVPLTSLGIALDPALLADRRWTRAVCTQRLEFLRAMHWWPQSGGAAVIAIRGATEVRAPALDGCETFVAIGLDARGHLTELVGADPAAGRAHAIPAWRAALDDHVSAIANATLVVTDDPTVTALARAFRRTVRAPAGGGAGAETGAEVRTDEARRAADVDALDHRLDEIVMQAGSEPRPITVSREIEALRAALDARGRRLAHERAALADYVRALRATAATDGRPPRRRFRPGKGE
jgi:hypothetical protein